MSTRATSGVYAGGYKRCKIALTVGDDGSINQQPDTIPVGYVVMTVLAKIYGG